MEGLDAAAAFAVAHFGGGLQEGRSAAFVDFQCAVHHGSVA